MNELSITEGIIVVLVERDNIDATNIVQHVRIAKQKIADWVKAPVTQIDFERLRDIDEIDSLIIGADI